MRALPRTILRLAALLLLAALLVGVPAVLFRTIGIPLPSGAQWRSVWTTGRVESDFVVRLGAAVFAVLWSWFAVTAVAELWRVVPRRRTMTTEELRVADHGPSGWVRGLVRFAVVSSVSASAALASIASTGAVPVAGAAGPNPSTAVVTESAATNAGTTHIVVAGDSYWQISVEHLEATLEHAPSGAEVAELTGELMSVNAPRLGHDDPSLIKPGELVLIDVASGDVDGHLVPQAPSPAPAVSSELPALVVAEAPLPAPAPAQAPLPVPVPAAPPSTVAVPAPPATTPTVGSPTVSPERASLTAPAPARSAYTGGLGMAVLMSAGAIAAVETRRRRQLRAGVVGTRLVAPTPDQVRTEVLLRSLSAPERVARLDVALRAVARDLARQRASVIAVVLGDAGDLRLFLRGAAVPESDLWQLDIGSGSWFLPASAPLDALTPAARECAQPCPALAHVGSVDEGGELFVDLETAGVLSIESPCGAEMVRALAASMSISPFIEAGRVFCSGAGDVLLGDGKCDLARSLAESLAAAVLDAGSMGSLARDGTTFSLRALDRSGEAWEPAVVFAAGVHWDDPALRGLEGAAGGRGLAVVVDAPVPNCVHRLRFDGETHVFEPLGLRVRPIGLDQSDVAAVASLLTAADGRRSPSSSSLEGLVAPVIDLDPRRDDIAAFEEPDWSVMVRLLGQVEVVTADGVTATFERSKALELIAWLAMHRERPTRMAARTALWDVDVRPATFANVVSDARRGIARAVAPPHGEEWIARTLTEDLPLHRAVCTDAELLALRVAAARGRTSPDAIELLRPGLELVTAFPFAGASYLWSDAEGHTSSLILLVTGAATELARHYLTLGDIEGVFWATGQGLRVLTGHEELIELRMRAHACRGNLAGVRGEWESYERALAADSWAAAEPAPKLVALRRELLSTATSVAGA